MKRLQVFLAVSVTMAGLMAGAEVMDRPTGIKIGQRMTLRPYLDLSFAYDSNPNQENDSDSVFEWIVNPGLTLDYKADNWMLDVRAYYRYCAYSRYVSSLNQHNYGESIRWVYANSARNEKGWSLELQQEYVQVNEDDSFQNVDGRGLWRNRQSFNIGGVAERRFNEKVHADINGSYYMLDYVNDEDDYAPLYGWQRWIVGTEGGYTLSKWLDLLLAISYQRYYQDNSKDLTAASTIYGTDGLYSSESQGYSIMGGFGSRMTERISYRAMAGWSRFEYGDAYTDNGFVYSLAVNWKIGETWNTVFVAQSSYQPSETEYGSADRVDSFQWGLAKSMVRNKLNATLDLAYRIETRQDTDISAYDYDKDTFSARLGFTYTLNRFLALFLHFEYQKAMYEGDTGIYDCDYDRFRATLGFRLTY